MFLFTVIGLTVAATGLAMAQSDATRSIFDRMDLDNDGAIDSDELAALRARAFNGMDRDLDGVLTEAEFVELWIAEAADEDDPRIEDITRLRRGRFAEMDEDDDGEIAKDAYLAVGNDRFLAADGDKDGQLSLEEFSGISGN